MKKKLGISTAILAVAAGAVALFGGNAVLDGPAKSMAQTPGTCEAKESAEERRVCIAIAECFGIDYKNAWEVVGEMCTSPKPATICRAAKVAKNYHYDVNCESGQATSVKS